MVIVKQLIRLKNLETLSYFDTATLSQYIDASEKALYANINRWLSAGILVPLKKGLYVTSEYLKTLGDKTAYIEFVANKLREPSYLSLECVLQKYSVLTDAIYSVTSITSKTTRDYQNQLGSFTYRNLSPGLFTGYKVTDRGGYHIREATRAKALFDYLYLKTINSGSVSAEMIRSLRLNLDEFKKSDWSELSKYCDLPGRTRQLSLFKNVRQAYDI